MQLRLKFKQNSVWEALIALFSYPAQCISASLLCHVSKLKGCLWLYCGRSRKLRLHFQKLSLSCRSDVPSCSDHRGLRTVCMPTKQISKIKCVFFSLIKVLCGNSRTLDSWGWTVCVIFLLIVVQLVKFAQSSMKLEYLGLRMSFFLFCIISIWFQCAEKNRPESRCMAFFFFLI